MTAQPRLGPARARAGRWGLGTCVQRGNGLSRGRNGSRRRDAGDGERAWATARSEVEVVVPAVEHGKG